MSQIASFYLLKEGQRQELSGGDCSGLGSAHRGGAKRAGNTALLSGTGAGQYSPVV